MYKAQFVFCLLVVISYAFAASLESVSGSSAQPDDANSGVMENSVKMMLENVKNGTVNQYTNEDASTYKSLDNQNDGVDDDGDESEDEENEDDDDDDEYDESRRKPKIADEDDPASYDSIYDDADK